MMFFVLVLDDKKESVMYQLQLMFAHLQESEKIDFNPGAITVFSLIFSPVIIGLLFL